MTADIDTICPHCGVDLYDRVALDPVRDMAVCPECRKCVGWDCPCPEAEQMRQAAP